MNHTPATTTERTITVRFAPVHIRFVKEHINCFLLHYSGHFRSMRCEIINIGGFGADVRMDMDALDNLRSHAADVAVGAGDYDNKMRKSAHGVELRTDMIDDFMQSGRDLKRLPYIISDEGMWV